MISTPPGPVLATPSAFATEELEREQSEEQTRAGRSASIRRVLAGEGLSIVLQPIVDLADGRVVAAEALSRLRSRGVQLVVDDAGAGFSSFRHVLGLHPDVIKLDLSLTRDIGHDPLRRALAASLVAFNREIGSILVAEGIETRAELETLRGLGVTRGQGNFLAAPAPGPVPEWIDGGGPMVDGDPEIALTLG